MNETVTMYVIVHGRVQGVFFRATTRDHARSIGVMGTVKNLPDGTVEMWAQGSKENLEILLNRLKKEPGMGEVSRFEINHPEQYSQFTSFDVVY